MPGFHLLDFAMDAAHRLAKEVQFASLSVGSTIRVPATGHDIVGAW
jgi:hypothetical protein